MFPLIVDILEKIDTTGQHKNEVIIKNKFFDFSTLKEKVYYKLNSKLWK